MSEFWVDQTVRKLGVALDFFGHRRDINSITVREVQGYVGHLQKLPNGHGGTLSGGSQRRYLNALSKLYGRAISNPIAVLMDKPRPESREAKWLENHEAALSLESARTFTSVPGWGKLPFP